MSDITTTNINNYIQSLCEEIENIDSIYRCRRYKGQLTNESLNKIKVKLRNNLDTEAFVSIANTQNSIDRVKRGLIYADLLIQVYIVGATNNNRDDLGYSDAVYDSAFDIYSMLSEIGNKIGETYIVGETVLGSLTNVDDEIENNVRTSILAITFTQRVRI